MIFISLWADFLPLSVECMSHLFLSWSVFMFYFNKSLHFNSTEDMDHNNTPTTKTMTAKPRQRTYQRNGNLITMYMHKIMQLKDLWFCLHGCQKTKKVEKFFSKAGYFSVKCKLKALQINES